MFKDYKIVLAVGNGRLEDVDDEFYEFKKSYDKVVKAIKENEKTITLSVGQLTTGITIPEWTAVLMLSKCKNCFCLIYASCIQSPESLLVQKRC